MPLFMWIASIDFIELLGPIQYYQIRNNTCEVECVSIEWIME